MSVVSTSTMEGPHGRLFLLFLLFTVEALSQDTALSTGSCNATDSRGVTWTAAVNEKQTQSCSLVDDGLTGEAEWFCVSSENTPFFNSTEPDRSKCFSELLSVENSLEALLNYTNDLDRVLTGGELAQIVIKVVDVGGIENEVNDLVNIIDNLLQSPISWSEIVGAEKVGGYDVKRNTRLFERLVERLEDFCGTATIWSL